jgi:glycogen synthase
MRILMFGWEFPPHISGGLGTACFGITKALTAFGHEVIFVIPRLKTSGSKSHVKFISASDVPVPVQAPVEDDLLYGLDVRVIHSLLNPYLNENQYAALFKDQDFTDSARERAPNEEKRYRLFETSEHYGANLISEVMRYGRAAGIIADDQTFDVIHAHDWMTVFAGLRAKKMSGKPLILHIHALEFDRSGNNVNQDILNIERLGMSRADHIIAVSHYTKNMIVNRYGIDPDKVTVVHNAVSRAEAVLAYKTGMEKKRKIVLFLGRVTSQKGPDYFIKAAARVLKEFPEVTFVMAGAGDMTPRMIELVAELGMGKIFHFTGFLRGMEVEKIFSMSDLYIMPSVS